MSKRALEGCRRSVVALDDLGSLASLFLQLEGRLKEVHVETRGRIEPSHGQRCFDTFETPIADQPANDGAVLLLNERLVVLLIGA